MDIDILSKEEITTILSKAQYWNEVNDRDSDGSTDIRGVLMSELSETINSLGLKTLWILEEYAQYVEGLR